MSGGHIEKPPKIPSQGIRHDIILNYSTRRIMLKSATTQWHQCFNQHKFSPHFCANVESVPQWKNITEKYFKEEKDYCTALSVCSAWDRSGWDTPHPPPPLTSPLHNTIIHTLHRALHTYSIQLFHYCKKEEKRTEPVVFVIKNAAVRMSTKGVKECILKWSGWDSCSFHILAAMLSILLTCIMSTVEVMLHLLVLRKCKL